MNDSHFSPDDPRLTAYALGEIDDADRVVVEAALKRNPALLAAVDDVRATAAQLTSAFASEAMAEDIAVAAAPRSANAERSSTLGSRATSARRSPGRLARLLQFPQSYYMIGGLAAASFAVFLIFYQPPPHDALMRKKYVEVSLPSASLPAPVEATVNAGPLPVIVLPAQEKAKREQSVATSADAADFRASEQAVGASANKPAENSGDGGSASTSLASAPPAVEVVNDGAARAKEAQLAQGSMAPVAVAAAEVDKSARRMESGSGADSVVTLDAFSVQAEPISGKLQAAQPAAPHLFVLEEAKQGSGRAYFRPAPGAVPAGGTLGTESYGMRVDNSFVGVAVEPLSTFSIDVDTASYANVRRFLQGGHLPPRDAVRVEELVNYFPYHYAPPTGDAPFAASLEVSSAPWEPSHRLVRIGLKGREVSQAARPQANLVFLLDVSGSMSAPNRLPLVKESMRLLVGRLSPNDHVAIVTYAGQSGLALPSTPVSQAKDIIAALDELSPGGSTNGANGIQLAYDIAKANFVPGGVNRVILCTDGDFNVGVTNRGDLVRLVEEKAKSNVFLTVLGFGMGNLKDETLESLADKGNGNYGYIDTRREAEKMLVDQVSGTLVTIAKDVKIQVEFNPAQVSSYRLIGYENRLLQKQDFNNDKVDAGEIGAGHTVTALYELVLAGSDEAAPTVSVDPLKYQSSGTKVMDEKTVPRAKSSSDRAASARELLTVKVRYKEPTGDVSRKLEFPLTDEGASFEKASNDFKFAAAVASFGLALRSSPAKLSLLSDAVRWAEAGLTDDAGGYRAEFLGLLRQAQKLIRE